MHPSASPVAWALAVSAKIVRAATGIYMFNVNAASKGSQALPDLGGRQGLADAEDGTALPKGLMGSAD
jgi:hypothetical protein